MVISAPLTDHWIDTVLAAFMFQVPIRPRTGVTGLYGATITTLTCLPDRQAVVEVVPSISTQVKVGLPRFGMSFFCVARTAAVSALLPRLVPRVDAGDARDLARGLRHAVVHVDATTEVEDAHQQHEEDRQREGELDECLATAASTAATPTAAHGVTVTVREAVLDPRRFDTVSWIVYVPGRVVDVAGRVL